MVVAAFNKLAEIIIRATDICPKIKPKFNSTMPKTVELKKNINGEVIYPKTVQNAIIDLQTIPSKTSELTNDSGFITSNAISGKEDSTNKVTSLSSSSTDVEYPSAKAVADYVSGIVGDINTILDEINGEVI